MIKRDKKQLHCISLGIRRSGRTKCIINFLKTEFWPISSKYIFNDLGNFITWHVKSEGQGEKYSVILSKKDIPENRLSYKVEYYVIDILSYTLIRCIIYISLKVVSIFFKG